MPLPLEIQRIGSRLNIDRCYEDGSTKIKQCFNQLIHVFTNKQNCSNLLVLSDFKEERPGDEIIVIIYFFCTAALYLLHSMPTIEKFITCLFYLLYRALRYIYIHSVRTSPLLTYTHPRARNKLPW